MKRIVVDKAWLVEVGQSVELPRESSNYVSRVLRLKKGAEFECLYGDGRVVRVRIAGVERARVTVNVLAVDSVEPPTQEIVLAAAMPKGERWEWLLQKVTELGVTSIVPLTCGRSEVKVPQAKLPKKMDRWERILLDATRQCGRVHAPALSVPRTFDEVVAEGLDEGASGFIAAVSSSSGPTNASASKLQWLVGPEGGFTEREVDAACAAGYAAVTLGPRILRAETAAVAAVALSQVRWGDMQ